MLVFLAGVVVGVAGANFKNIVLAVKAAHKATVTSEPAVTVVNTPIVTTAPKVGE